MSIDWWGLLFFWASSVSLGFVMGWIYGVISGRRSSP